MYNGWRKAVDFDLGKITAFSQFEKDGNQIAVKKKGGEGEGWIGIFHLFKETWQYKGRIVESKGSKANQPLLLTNYTLVRADVLTLFSVILGILASS